MRFLKIFIAILIIFALIMLFLYFCNFADNGFSERTEDWGYFGSYVAAITGVLAFIGVLWSILKVQEHYDESQERAQTYYDETKKQAVEDSNRAYVFQLIDLHMNKYEKVVNSFYEENLGKFIEKKGAEAFKEYTQQANKYYKSYIVCQVLLKEWDSQGRNASEVFISLKIEKRRDSLESSLTTFFNKNGYKEDVIPDSNFIFKSLENYIDSKKEYPLLSYSWLDDIFTAVQTSITSIDDISKGVSLVGNMMYKKNGHILGHYFRNMYYVMKHIRSIDNEGFEYYKLFRAQISRYEIALGLFNAMSSRSSVEMIELLKYYKIFDELYYSDISSIFVHEDENTNKELLNLYVIKQKFTSTA